MKKLKFIILILIILVPALTQAQPWKRIRYEAMFGFGFNNCFTDLGGANRDGTHFARDMEFSKSRPMLFLGARYKIKERFAVKLNFIYARIAASDLETEWEGRLNRGLTARSPLFDNTIQAEYSITKERFGPRYTFARLRNIRNLKVNTYVFAGVGWTFNAPKLQIDGTWYPAKEVDQDILRTSKKENFHKSNIAFPIGIGFKYGINRRWSLGIEFSERFSTSDYLEGYSDINSTANDSYVFMLIQFSYKLRTAKNGLPKF
ncbi:MAG: hypothetical protein A2W91_09020 [Bacteroidetes bacterium GWF2_38_335]|nr:MAG: hypothetical protein A2W91_09020 [Bacteroidetes bacterium GWF2_38_335]OFY80513.1 MAG: hypothetical protein A2281_08745 [Bacteroidetes bacterium RIFOXYA12_FULL_38_20]HBS85877.1 hypothetical protein [Bacteroidales bacterium]